MEFTKALYSGGHWKLSQANQTAAGLKLQRATGSRAGSANDQIMDYGMASHLCLLASSLPDMLESRRLVSI